MQTYLILYLLSLLYNLIISLSKTLPWFDLSSPFCSGIWFPWHHCHHWHTIHIHLFPFQAIERPFLTFFMIWSYNNKAEKNKIKERSAHHFGPPARAVPVWRRARASWWLKWRVPAGHTELFLLLRRPENCTGALRPLSVPLTHSQLHPCEKKRNFPGPSAHSPFSVSLRSSNALCWTAATIVQITSFKFIRIATQKWKTAVNFLTPRPSKMNMTFLITIKNIFIWTHENS